MTNNAEENHLTTDEEYRRALKECCENCCASIKSLPRSTKERISKKYFAFIGLIVAIVLLGVAIAFLRMIAVTYTAAAVLCSVVAFLCDRGVFPQRYMNLYRNPEQQRLLGQWDRHFRRGEDQYREDGTSQSFQSDLETLMEPRPGNEGAFAARSPYQVPYDFHHYDVYIPPDNNESSAGEKFIYGEFSVGPSSAPDPFPALKYGSDSSDSSTSCTSPAAVVTSSSSFEHITDSSEPTHFEEEICGSDQPSTHLSEARLSGAGLRAFGEPLNLYGADSYGEFLSSGEQNDSKESSMSLGLSEKPKLATKASTYEVSVEVHSEPNRLINPNNDVSSSVEPELVSNDAIAQIVDSDSHDDIPYMDDEPSSKSTCSTPLDEESTKTED